LTEADYPPVHVDVWPCCEEAVAVFFGMATQWRVGMAGAVGLVYEALPVVLRSLGIRRKALRRLLPDLQVMERAALAAHAKD
jgi:hypothetical protein